MFDYEWAALQHHVNCRFADRVLVPDAIPPERLRRYGARPPKLVRYPGLKEEYYLAGFEPDATRARAARRAGRRECCASSAPRPRTRSTSAAPRARCCRALLRRLAGDEERADRGARANAGAARRDRARSGCRAWSSRSAPSTAAASSPSPTRSSRPGGTMNREAAVLGTPVWSIFEGRLGAVDEQLVARGAAAGAARPRARSTVEQPASAARAATRGPRPGGAAAAGAAVAGR